MSSFEAFDAEWGECWLEPVPMPPDLAAEVRTRTGSAVPPWASRLATVPWVVRGFFMGIDKPVAHMAIALSELIDFVVSQDNACRYCYGATRTILKIVGYRDDAIDRLERDIDLADVAAPDKAALRFARQVSRANPLPDRAELDRLRGAGFSDPAVAEIAFCAAFAGYGNRVSTMVALPPDDLERILDGAIRRLLRPLIARQFRGKRHSPAALPVPNDPPFATVIAALDGSPAAHTVRRIVDDALASPVLPRRTKLLMTAVVARALGSAHVEADARSALAADGLGAADVDDVLLNLGSPRLDDRERLLVPFVRETVRYRSPALQQRTRALAAHLGRAELIEAVGVAALANSVGRLAVLVESC